MHPVHETVTEVQWNFKTHRMEVAVRLAAEDERWIRAKMGPDAKDDETENGRYLICEVVCGWRIYPT